MTVSQETIDRYREDGAVCLRGAFDREWIEALRQGIDRNMASPGRFYRKLSGEGEGGFYSDSWSWFEIDEFRRFAFESPAAAIAGEAMGAREVRLLQDTWFVKLPGTQDRTPWHHDHVVRGNFCSVWMPLDPHPVGTSLELVRGSHLWGKLFMPKAYFEKDASGLSPVEKYYQDFHGGAEGGREVYALTPDVDAEREAYEILSWDLEPGDCIVFNALTLHGAPGNASHEQTARRFVTRWTGEDAVVATHAAGTLEALRQHGFSHNLKPGDPLSSSSDLFPVLWSRS
jgi:ectoine hydroxylase-related dioxygenase (phytanoyl-CoA dioxygenase family)